MSASSSNYHQHRQRMSNDSDKTASSAGGHGSHYDQPAQPQPQPHQTFFKRPQLSDFNPFSSTSSSHTPQLMSDNEYVADPLENAVSPTTKNFDPQNQQWPLLDNYPNTSTNGRNNSAGSQGQDRERKHSKAPFHRLRTALSNAHLGRGKDSRRASPEMSNYDSTTLHPEYRRPSYASQTTQSSTGSRRSHTEGSGTESPMHGGSTSLPQSLDPSELSLITNMPAASATALDSSLYATSGNGNNGPVSYPDPEQVFDTESMYQEQQRAMHDQYNQQYYNYNPTYDESRSDSVASSISDAKPKRHHKRSIFNLVRRRESSADLKEKNKDSKEGLYKGLKHKASDTILPLRQASQSSQFSKAPSSKQSSTSSQHPLHKHSVPYESEVYGGEPRTGRQRSKSSSHQQPADQSKPLPPVPRLDALPQDLLTDFRGSRMFNLDTNLGQMQGIVQQADQKEQPELDGQGRPKSSQSWDDSKRELHPLTPMANGQAGGNATASETIAKVQGPVSEWTAPESWGVVEKAQKVPSPPDSTPSWGDGFDQDQAVRKKANHCLRVFREDGTFGTLSCPIDITVSELLQMLGRKFFLSSVTGYELSTRTGGLTRILEPQEKPLLYQKMLLEFMGYTEKDRLGDVGREDLSYLCRFEFGRSAMKAFTPEEDALMTRDFVHVSLQKMNLQTIPIVFYQHTSEIEVLDVSKNPSISLPLDFIQACTNLRQVRFVDNQARRFPANIDKAVRLTSLDLSNNLILDLDHVDFENFPLLTSLDLQGNRLKEISPQIAAAQLRYLNLSSNNLTQIPVELCDLTALVDLDLSFNHIFELPEEICKLKRLERLLMTNNDLTSRLPETFCDLSSLRELDIRYNKLQNIDILSKLPKLEVLYCSKNSVYSFEDAFIRLKLFYFDRNPITRISFKDIHSSLAVLNLSKAKLASLPENVLEKIPMVEKLVLDKNHLVSLPPHIGTLKRLISLSIVGNKLSNLPPEIGQLQDLQILDLHSNNLKSLPDEIWNLGSIAVLNASSNLLEAFPSPQYHLPSVSSTTSGAMYRETPIDTNYEIRLNSEKRRPSEFSSSSAMSPKDMAPGQSRRGSSFPHNNAATTGTSSATTTVPASPIATARGSTTSEMDMGPGGRRTSRGLSQSLLVLSLADNRLPDDCFGPISQLSNLQILNLSYNDLMEVPTGALGMLPQLTELYLSGNSLTGLPSDDFEHNQALRVFHVNGNKLHSLPAELGKMPHLCVLDVGSNNLRYNINNWPYDWNWNWNLSLKYLNFSGNQKLEVKRDPNRGVRDTGERNLSDFTVLEDIRVLGLMDVTLTIPSVPDQTENCRVRTYGSSVLTMKYGMADSLGNHNNLSVMDMVIERFRGNEKEAVLGLFDGRNATEDDGNKVSKLTQETFGGVFSDELNKLREGETTRDALRRAFLYTNKEIGNTTMLPTEEIAHSSIAHRSSTAANLNPQDRMTGSCATIVYVNDNKLYVANVGDSMAIMTKCTLGDYQVLTKRHDPTSQEELARIRGGAGVVSANGKLDGILDVSRAIGFYNLIPHIHAAPSIFEYELTGSEDYLIIASKQLWEYVSFENAFDVARTQLHNPMLAAQKLRDFAIAYGCTDKIMVMCLAVGTKNKKPSTFPARMGSGSVGLNYGRIPGYEEELFSTSVLKKRRDRSFLPEDSTLARLGSEVEPPVGDVAMVFTDIKNSTLLWETYPVAMRSAIKIHNTIMRRQILIMRGYEVKTEGDAFIVSFPTPTSALLWCFSVQQQLLLADWPSEILASEQGCDTLDANGEVIFRGLSVRMGAHWGTPVFEPDVITKRMDYFGPMVNRTARISAVADGGQITLSTDFLSEMKTLGKAHERVEKDSVSLAEAYGNEIVGESINKDMAILDSLGWVVKEIGEMKLKGLENPEMIHAAYQKSLLERYEMHAAAREETPNAHGVLTSQAAAAAWSSSKHAKTSSSSAAAAAAARHRRGPGNLTVDLLVRLRSISNRLEKICSQMNNQEDSLAIPGGRDDDDPSQQYNRKTGRNIQQQTILPSSSDGDLVMFFELLVTRIENAMSTLYIRAAMGSIDRYQGRQYRADLGDMLTLLSTLLASNDGTQNQHHDVVDDDDHDDE